MTGMNTTNVLIIIVIIILIAWLIIWWLNRGKSISTMTSIQDSPTIAVQNPPISNLTIAPSVTPPTTAPSIMTPDNKPLSYQSSASACHTLYYFYNPRCPHCVKFTPKWNELVQRQRSTSDYNLTPIDTSNPENENLRFYFGVNSVPRIIIVSPDKKFYEYNGPMNIEDIANFEKYLPQ